MESLPFPKAACCIALLAALLVVAPVNAQTQSLTQPASGATFTANAELVLVPVVVRKGKQPVFGLTEDDFAVYEDKALQRIAFVKPATSAARLNSATGANVFTNQRATGGEAPHLSIIALDTLNTPFQDQDTVRRGVLKFLSDSPALLEPTALVAFTPNGLRLVHDFTTDSAALSTALEAASGKTPHTASQANPSASSVQEKPAKAGGVLSMSEPDSPQDLSWLLRKLTATLEELTIVAQSMSGIPGRKTMIWFTGSFPFSLDDPGSFLLPSQTYYSKGGPKQPNNAAAAQGQGTFAGTYSGGDSVSAAYQAHQGVGTQAQIFRNDELKILRPLYERTMKLLADANVAVYPVDARGEVVTFPGVETHTEYLNAIRAGTFDLGQGAAAREAQLQIYMRTFAEATGASPCYSKNELATCLHIAVTDSQSYYLLAYYRDRKNNKPGWRTLNVKVNRPDVQVIARNGYFYLTESPDSDEARRRDISYALVSPIDFPGIPFQVQVKQSGAAEGGLRALDFQVRIPPGSLPEPAAGDRRMSLDVVGAAATPDGKLVDQFSKTMKGSLKAETAAAIQQRGVSYDGSLRVPRGELTLRFIVRDNLSGRIGSVVVPFAAE